MAGTMTNIENNTIRMYWNALRSMSKNIRLGLAVKLTNSVLEEERKEMSDEAYTEEMLNKFFGKWEGNETAEELMGIIRQAPKFNRDCKTPCTYRRIGSAELG